MRLELNDGTAALLLNALNCYSEGDSCSSLEIEAAGVLTDQIMDLQCEKEMRRIHRA